MSYFYIDDSIHNNLAIHNNHVSNDGFCLAAIIYTEKDVDNLIRKALVSVNLPYDYEFKSYTRKKNDPIGIELRKRLFSIISSHCKIGVVITSIDDRGKLGIECLKCIGKIINMHFGKQNYEIIF